MQHLRSTLTVHSTCYITPSALQLCSGIIIHFVILASQLALTMKIFLSHHQSCETGVSVILQSRALRQWSGDTCLWCPHTPTQNGLLHHTSGTQRSSEARGEIRPTWLHSTLLYVCTGNVVGLRDLIITWLFFPSSLGTSRLRTETNLDSKQWKGNDIN